MVTTLDQTSNFKWGLWITQIKCDGSTSLQSPKGCFQYFTQSQGSLTSFAFQPNGQYLSNQAYKICIMTSKGSCRISFQATDFGLEKFGNYKTSPYNLSGVSSGKKTNIKKRTELGKITIKRFHFLAHFFL